MESAKTLKKKTLAIRLKDKKPVTHSKVRGTLFKPGQGKSKL